MLRTGRALQPVGGACRGRRRASQAEAHPSEQSSGQGLAEFAIVAPIFFLVIGAVIQFALIFWAQNTLNQVTAGTARWAATQLVSPCDSITTIAAQSDAIARSSALVGYTGGQWTGTYTSHGLNPGSDPLLSAPPFPRGVEAFWRWTAKPGQSPPAGPCPPTDNSRTWTVTIRTSHQVPLFFPLPLLNSQITATATVEMEPSPQ